jgi:hypothetical protein
VTSLRCGTRTAGRICSTTVWSTGPPQMPKFRAGL